MDNTKVEYKSLYDFLGKRAGGELGKQVFEKAKLTKVPFTTRMVSQGGYNGKVMTYPIEFLNNYFNKTTISEFNQQSNNG